MGQGCYMIALVSMKVMGCEKLCVASSEGGSDVFLSLARQGKHVKNGLAHRSTHRHASLTELRPDVLSCARVKVKNVRRSHSFG
jgi:hypothetical protein